MWGDWLKIIRAVCKIVELSWNKLTVIIQSTFFVCAPYNTEHPMMQKTWYTVIVCMVILIQCWISKFVSRAHPKLRTQSSKISIKKNHRFLSDWSREYVKANKDINWHRMCFYNNIDIIVMLKHLRENACFWTRIKLSIVNTFPIHQLYYFLNYSFNNI